MTDETYTFRLSKERGRFIDRLLEEFMRVQYSTSKDIEAKKPYAVAVRMESLHFHLGLVMDDLAVECREDNQ